ncbi:DUF4430 domain-containing protein [Lancefieldella parvula]|uniref:DUF4430 domain-containing protein n=1 Tax=Lancefieldella parvula TaxID=1382 RepID=UPI00288004CA|nr:DUF4430 domain-containing protein [Lancefieldella parvula]
MIKFTRESKRIVYLAASIVSLLFMLFFAWTLVQYFFALTSSASSQEAPNAVQGQTVAEASGTQTDSQTAQTQGSSGSDTQSNSDASKTQDSSNQNTSEPESSSSDNSTNDAVVPHKDKSTLSVNVTVDGSAAKGFSFSVNLQVQEGASVYDALLASGAGVNARSTSFGMYVAAINGLAERDHGPQSGWVYSVNGVQPNYTSDAYILHDGDSVVWTYVNAVN